MLILALGITYLSIYVGLKLGIVYGIAFYAISLIALKRLKDD